VGPLQDGRDDPELAGAFAGGQKADRVNGVADGLVLAYDMKRMIRRLGTTALIKTMQTQRQRARSPESGGAATPPTNLHQPPQAPRFHTASAETRRMRDMTRGPRTPTRKTA
jgi:hypothetical protein